MSVPVMKGPRITLRPVMESDIDARVTMGRDPDFIRMCGGSVKDFDPTLTRERMESWYRKTITEPCHWCIEHEGRFIGTARLHHVVEGDRRAMYAIGINDPTARGRGFGTEATRLVLGYAFGVLGLHRVGLRVLEYNHRAIACYEKCGFIREGIERESCPIDGVWHSDVMMGILEDGFRELKAGWPEFGGIV